MGLKATFNKEVVRTQLQKAHNLFVKLCIENLTYIGEEFVANARNNGNYTDRTGNLRSSVGYVILYDGKIVSRNFEPAQQGTDKTKGVNVGQSYAEKLAENYPKGAVLIVVAGMEYASLVEKKRRDVLTASSIGVERDIAFAIDRIKNKLNSL